MKKNELKEYEIFDTEVFEPDFEFSDELNACACLCGLSAGAGGGSAPTTK